MVDLALKTVSFHLFFFKFCFLLLLSSFSLDLFSTGFSPGGYWAGTIPEVVVGWRWVGGGGGGAYA